MQILLLLDLIAFVTAIIVVAGIILLFWRRTRPFGLYTLLVEPGAVAGSVLAAFLWWQFPNLLPDSGWPSYLSLIFWILWLGLGALLGAFSGLILATWLWWRYSPEPYRPKLVAAYQKIVTMQPIFRQPWRQRRKVISAHPNQDE